MATRSITRLASAAVVTGIATLAFAGPADAQYPKEPDLGARVEVTGTGTPTVDDGWELSQIASGALGGIALAGVGVAAAAGLRRHSHAAHPV
ncbi:MAG TPA: hypothetical protein VJ819_13175 [Nocardioidaceae bacterium]|jgi:hypothetical protein|nr:hypothetical protein [Nocardioidaceae bacterium]